MMNLPHSNLWFMFKLMTLKLFLIHSADFGAITDDTWHLFGSQSKDNKK